MIRFLALVLVATLSSCSPPESTSSSERALSETPTADSSVVVPSEPGVPSDDRPVVVFLGTSLTAGLGLDDPDAGYVARLEAIADSAGLPFRGVNAGVSGETSAGGLRRLDWVLRDPVDVLVVELGANDGLRGQSVDALAENLREIIRRTRARRPDAEILLTAMEAPPNLGERYTSAFRTVFPRVAKSEDVGLIPFPLEGVAGVPELNQPDRIHPTAEGHRIMARNIWPHLQPVVTRASEGG